MVGRFDPNGEGNNVGFISKNDLNTKYQSEDSIIGRPSKDYTIMPPPGMNEESAPNGGKVEQKQQPEDSSKAQRNRFALQMSFDATKLRPAKHLEEYSQDVSSIKKTQ